MSTISAGTSPISLTAKTRYGKRNQMRETGPIHHSAMNLTLFGVAILFVTTACPTGAQPEQKTSLAGPSKVTDDASARRDEISDRPVLQQRNPRYQLCHGDTFDLSFPFTPEFNQTVTVHPDGFITLAGLGDLYVLGKTVPELR